MTSEPSQDSYRPPSGRMYAPGTATTNGTRSLYRRKWQSLERCIPDVIMQMMTTSNRAT